MGRAARTLPAGARRWRAIRPTWLSGGGACSRWKLVPFYWLQLNKGGGSNIKERKSLIEGMISLAKAADRSLAGSILLADREFIGQQWFQYLLSKNLSFVIRLREKMYFELQTYTGKKNFIKVFS
jgi:hypothetical protein